MIALMTDVMISMMVLDDFDARGCLGTVTCDVYGDLDDGNVREGFDNFCVYGCRDYCGVHDVLDNCYALIIVTSKMYLVVLDVLHDFSSHTVATVLAYHDAHDCLDLSNVCDAGESHDVRIILITMLSMIILMSLIALITVVFMMIRLTVMFIIALIPTAMTLIFFMYMMAFL
jgi:hypothetical protein